MFPLHALARAYSLLLRNGYHGTSVRMLAKELDTTVQEIYGTVGGKGPCVAELLRYEESLLTELQENAAGDGRSARQTLKSWLEGIQQSQVRGGSPRGLLCVNLAFQLGAQEEELRRETARMHDRLIKWIGGLMGRIEPGKDRPADREVAEFILASVAGSILLAVADQDYWELNNGLARLQEYVDGL